MTVGSLLGRGARRRTEGADRGRLRGEARLGGPTDSDRIVIVISTILGVGYLVYAGVSLPVMIEEAAGVVAGWYPAFCIVVVFAPGLALFGVRWARRPAVVGSAVALACPAATLVAAAVWVLAGTGDSVDPAVWMLDFAGLPAVAVAVARPMREALVALVMCKAAAVAVALAHSPTTDVGAMMREGAFGMLFTSAFVYITAMVVRAGSALDSSRCEAADLTAVGVRNAELARIDGLIHDHVISTLVAVTADPADPRVVEAAQAALARLDALAADDGDDEVIAETELVARIRTAVDPSVATVVDVSRDLDGCYPVAVGRSLAEAVGEAVRNSRIHAGEHAECVVAIEVTGDRVAVTVADDGVGFDPSTVAIDRLGLALSVRRRMGSLEGGRAHVRSSPGRGTTVELEWIRP
ncbi:ATP-binding protein [Gordonia humi]|uniref:Two-component sensor histidine kinase n=1 Tax=Gordonia humi TaxID=686429 RepID=A0A840EUP3_9ACTN|nr:two-component sensor histidine kinase [Gordonia humi]